MLQTQYDTKLMNATYDGIKAFEINSTYNDLSNVSDTLREDVEAAISTFMGSLATSFGVSGYREENIKPYVPAVLFTLYDGYYIYAPTRSATTGEYEYMLKPYNYYTVRYRQSDRNDVIINYTLDNYIVVYGWIDGEYIVTSGYLVTNKHAVEEKETLYATVPVKKRAVGAIVEIASKEITNYEYSPNYTNDNLGQEDTRTDFLYPRNEIFYVNPESAQNYYTQAEKFTTQDIGNKLSWIRPNMAMRNGEYLSDENNEEYDEWFDDDRTQVFNFNDNDPEDPNSIFAAHKTNVIRSSIQSNLRQAITAYNQNSGVIFDFRLPKLKTEEWDRISTNIGMLTFLQGLPVGTKYYNNYSLVTSTTNKLYVTKDNLYFITNNDNYYHKIDCPHLGVDGLVGFSAFDYETKRVKGKNGYIYYHKHNINETESKKACYYCIVSSNYTTTDINDLDASKQKAYYTAVAREKKTRYTTTNYFGTN